MSDAVPFRFEIPNRVWAADGELTSHLLDIFCEPGAFIEIGEEPPPFDRDVSVLVGRAHRAVLAELGPLVEACWRPVSGDQEGTSGCDCHDERDSLSIARSQPMPPSAQQVTALLSRARYAHQFREPVYVTPDEMKALDTTDTYALLPCTLFGVQVAVNPRRAEAQIADAIAHPAPPMDWEVGAERNAMDGFGPAYPGATAGA